MCWSNEAITCIFVITNTFYPFQLLCNMMYTLSWNKVVQSRVKWSVIPMLNIVDIFWKDTLIEPIYTFKMVFTTSQRQRWRTELPDLECTNKAFRINYQIFHTMPKVWYIGIFKNLKTSLLLGIFKMFIK